MNNDNDSTILLAEHPISGWLPATHLAGLEGLPSTVRGVNKRADKDGWNKRVKRGQGGGYEYETSSLPQEAQIALYLRDIRTAEVQVNPSAIQGLIVDAKAVEPLTDRQRISIHATYDRTSKKAKATAAQRLMVIEAYAGLSRLVASETDRKAIIKTEFDVSPTTLWRWLQRIAGQAPQDWLALLAPRTRTNVRQVPFSAEAWDFIKQEWGTTSRPTLKSVYRRARRLAGARNWNLPSYEVVKIRVRKLPESWKILHREGIQALLAALPAQQRDYSMLDVHDLWESDGHKLDVFCRWPDGHIGRPILVVWRDVRTRKVLGWSMGKSESSDLIRLALRKAMERSGAVPRAALMDNGRGYASKLITGGAETRYRFKVKEEEPLGIVTMLGIKTIWAQPHHGQSKPVESFFRVVCDHVSKHSDFVGAYCGNNPDAKPENFDPKHAVDIAEVTRRLEQELDHYHEREHLGDGMAGQSPNAVYDELIQHAQVRTPTPMQLRLCLLAAQKISLRKKDHTIHLLGNRYWSEALAELSSRGPYDVRFDPEDATVPVAIYDGDRYVCEAKLLHKTGFRDRDAAREHARYQRSYVKAKKAQYEAQCGMVDAKRWEREIEPEPQETPPELPAAPVPELVHLKFPPETSTQPPAGTPFDDEAFDRQVEDSVWLLGKKR